MTVLYAHIMLKVYSFGKEICPFGVNYLPLRNGVTSMTFLRLAIGASWCTKKYTFFDVAKVFKIK